MNNRFGLRKNSDGSSRSNTEESRPKHMHRRTISKTDEDLLQTISTLTPPLGKSQLLNPEELRERLKAKGICYDEAKPRLQTISEEEDHIRKIISQRKNFSSTLSPIPKPACNFYENKQFFLQDHSKGSINSNTTNSTFGNESPINRILEILKSGSLKNNEFESCKEIIKDLLLKSPEPRFALILDAVYSVKGVYYVEGSTGYLHRIFASDELPLMIAPRRICLYLSFDSKSMAFVASNSETFEAVVLT
jgi:hypothetical protein